MRQWSSWKGPSAALVVMNWAVLCGSAAGPQAPPAIGQNGVVNAASQIAPTLAGGAIARGALFTVYGVRLGSLGHTSVTINGVPATVVKAEARQIEAIMPMSARLGANPLVVAVDRQGSKPFTVDVAASNPGIFSQNGEGWGPARSEVTTSRPARAGQRITLVTTGLGDAKQITVVAGGRPVGALRQGDKITFRIPADAPRGCYVPVYIQAAPARASNVVTLAIGAQGCDSGPVPLVTGAKLGVVGLSRAVMKARRKNLPDAVVDDARISFAKTGKEPVLSPIRLLPPVGSCTAYTSSFQASTTLSNSIGSIIGPEGQGLDGGRTLALRGSGGFRAISENARSAGNYRTHLGLAGIPMRPGAPGLFLEPGGFVLSGSGGKDVGPFQVRISIPHPFEWLDRDAIGTVDRSRGVTVHWKGVSPDQLVLILARNVDQITTGIGMCLCLARSAPGQFTIPASLLANVPVSRNLPGTAYDELVLATLPSKAPQFRASGIDTGFVFSAYATGRIVEYR